MKFCKTKNKIKTKQLSSFIKIGRKKRIINDETDVSFIRMQDITNKINNKKKVKYYTVKKGYSYFENNDIMLAKITPCFENGKCFVAEGLINNIGFGSTEFMVLNEFNNFGIHNFIKYVISDKYFRKNGAKKMVGSGGQRRIPKEYVLNKEIIDVEINDYKKIASVLSKQERQVEIIETLIEKLEKRNQYYAEKLLSGEKRIRKNEQGEIEFYDNTEWQDVSLNGKIVSIPKDWIKMKISDFFEINMGQTILSRNISNNNDGNVPVFSATEKFKAFGYIDIKKINKNRLLKENDLVIGARGTIGSIHKMKYLSTSTQTTIQCRRKEDDNNICFHYIKNYRKSLFKQEGGAIPQLTVYNMNELEIIYNKLESLEINNYLNILIDEKETLEKLLIKEKLRFQWMLDNLLSGEYQIVD